MPGSGKSTYLETHKIEFGDAMVCDDYYRSATSRPRSALNFEGSAYYVDLKSALENGKNVVIADILFCQEEYRSEMQSGLEKLLLKLNLEADVQYRFFENNPPACISNIMRRSRPERVNKELKFIEEVKDEYRIPEQAIILPVYQL